jgi:uncharacterized protein (DUF58 family)
VFGGVTRAGVSALLAAGVLIVLGAVLHWRGLWVIGLGLLLLLLAGLAVVLRPSRLVVERQIQPPRVPKHSTAIAFLTFANRGRTSVGPTVANQAMGDTDVRTVIPRLRRGEQGSRAYRLPTRQRGIFDVGPVEVNRADPFGLFRRTRKHGDTERIWVYPRLLAFKTLPAGLTRHLEGPTSDTAPAGNITFHRLRDYVVGDDLRMVHWRSSARTGSLVVKHNVDTSQPYTVVLLDQRPDWYSADTFESAVDVAASVLAACSLNKAPVELRLTDSTVVGGPRLREVTPLLDHLTGVRFDDSGSLRGELVKLRRARGGTSLVVVTGMLITDDLPHVAALRRRFEQLVVLSLGRPDALPVRFPGVRIIQAPDADGICSAWNLGGRP